MTTPKEGIFIRKNARGFYFTFVQNGRILCTGTGYNTKQACVKGIHAVGDLYDWKVRLKLVPAFVDLTKKTKAKKK